MSKARFYDGDTLKVLYSADDPELENKTVKVIGNGVFRYNDFWYDCEYNGKTYSLCESQLWYKD